MGDRALGALCGVLLVWSACGGSSDSGPAFEVEAQWSDREPTDCRPFDLVLTVREADVVLRARGHEAAAADGIARLIVPQSDVGDTTAFTAEVVKEGTAHEVSVEVPAPPGRAIEFPERDGAIDTHWSGFASLEAGNSDKGRYAWGAWADSRGRLQLLLPCATVEATAEAGTFERIDGAPAIVVDLDDSLKSAASADGKVELNVTATLVFARSKGRMEFTGSYDVRPVLNARFRSVAEHPVAWAPAFAKGTKQSVLISHEDRIDDALLPGPLAEVALVAVVTAEEIDEESCGPYTDAGLGIEDVYVPRTRIDSRIALVEAKTGAEVATTELAAKRPACPRTARGVRVDGHLGSDDRVVGRVQDKAIAAWIRKQR